MKALLPVLIVVALAPYARAQLAVNVSPAKVTTHNAVVSLALSNGLGTKVESARAAVFLLDERKKMVAQGTRWIIGGEQNKGGLAVGATNSFHFVIAGDKPLSSTNLTVKVSMSRVVLQGGRLADVNRDVRIGDAGN